jgi:RNA polymerase sigma factor (sigma-70 family)
VTPRLTEERKRLAEDHLWILGYWFRRYRSHYPARVPRDELIAEAMHRLTLAAANYDPGTGIPFVPYALKCIYRGTHKYVDLYWRPTRNRSAVAGYAVREVTFAQFPADGDGDWGDRHLAIGREPSPDAGDDADEVRHLLRWLGPRELRVLELRYGLDGGGERTLQEIGDEMGVSRERANQLTRRAVEAVRRRATA